MSGNRPTLNDYFARARTDGQPDTEPTLSLLAEYKTKAQRRRKRRAAVAVAISCALLGAVGFEFSSQLVSTPGGAFADARKAGTSGSPTAVHTPHSTALSTAPEEAPEDNLLSSAHNSRTVHKDRHSTHKAIPDHVRLTIAAPVQSGSPSGRPTLPVLDMLHTSDTDSGDIATSTERSTESAQYNTLHNAAMLSVVPQYAPTAQRFIAPPEKAYDNTVAIATSTPSSAIALTAGVRYGSATTNLSAINEQLAQANLPALANDISQTTVQAGVVIGNASFGVAYTVPYSDKVQGQHAAIGLPNSSVAIPSATTAFSSERWAAYAEYSFALTDNLSLDAGAQFSVSSYAVTLQSNYTPPQPLGNATDVPESGDEWAAMWRNISPPDATSNLETKTQANQTVDGMTAHSLGISPMLGLSWRPLPMVGIHCKVGYMINVAPQWRHNATGESMSRADSKLKLNEYSISIGASFYQWLL